MKSAARLWNNLEYKKDANGQEMLVLNCASRYAEENETKSYETSKAEASFKTFSILFHRLHRQNLLSAETPPRTMCGQQYNRHDGMGTSIYGSLRRCTENFPVRFCPRNRLRVFFVCLSSFFGAGS